MRLWLSADTGVVKLGVTDSVQYWNDYAGGNDTARQVTAANMPRLVNGGPLVNNKPVLAFDGNNDIMTGPALTGLGAGGYTVFVLANGNNQTGNSSYGLFGVSNGEGAFDIFRRAGTGQNIVVLAGSATSAPAGSFPATGYPYRLISVTQTTGTSGARLRVNDTLVATGTLGTFADDIYTVGKANATINGNIAEIMVFPTVLNDSVRRMVERYVYDKYAPPVNLGPDIVQAYSLCPIILNASNRFVRYLWSDGSTADTLRVKIGGTYWVRATDVFGRVSSDTIKVTLPYGGTSFVDTVLCYGSAATLQPIISSSPYTYAWNSGQNTSTISIAEQGSYVVAITDTNACVLISDTVDVKVDSFNLVSLLPTDTTTCTGNVLAIDNHGYAISAVNWSTGANAESIVVGGAGAYTVTAVSDNQCTLNDSINIAIKGVAPTVDFSVTDVCLGNANQFNDLSNTQAPDQVSSWYWDFGDNNTDIAPTISHAYNGAGIYNVTLTVLTDSGCSAAMSKTATVFSLPSAVISQLAPICAQNGSRISGVSVAPVGAAIASYEWQVAGNIVSSDTTLRYNFLSQGVVPVTLIVTSTQGCADTTTRSIEVYAPFVAEFEVDNVCVGDSSFFFDVTPSYSIVSRTWNFGDATSAIGTPNPVKKYNAAGSYDVTLTVTNAIGCRSIKTKPVIAASKPIANFNVLEGCEGDFYKPIDASSSAQEPISSWQWIIGGFMYNSQAPQRYFATPGTYPVKLVVATATGCKDSISKTAVIHAKPTVNFSYTPLYGDAPLNVTFTNQSSNDSAYFWQFGDGGTSAQENPVYTYTQNGEYNVTLVATSPYGCTASRTKPYSVIKTDLDYAVNEAAVQITPLPNGSSLAKVSVIGSNIGTRIIDHVSYYVTLGGVGVIAEDWQGTLLSGQGLLDTFSAQFVVPDGKGDSYICVTAVSVNNGQQELRTDNNSQCLGITEGIKVMGPLPNPALNESKLGLILPKHGRVTLDIANMLGQYIVQGLELELPEGRSDYDLPVGQMTAGEYFIRILYNDEKIVRKFIISR